VACQECGNRTETVEDAFIVSMSIPDVNFGQTLTIADCLRGFVRETRLLVDANNGYDCERCSRQPKKQTRSSPFARKKKRAEETEIILRDASMRMFVSELPKVLVIHLKRLGRTKKITHHIVFDTQLDMLPYVASSLQRNGKAGAARYELIAVVVHMGGKRGGHYVAYVSRSPSREVGSRRSKQQPQDSEGQRDANGEGSSGDARVWYYVSDTLVKRVELEQVLKCEAYMLFYQQLPPSQ
jgi:ubiquitin C-terminal hydrolase